MHPSPKPGRNASTPLRSDFADDEDMGELVRYFIEQLPGHIDRLRNAAERHDVAALKSISHQLKGAAGGYGFGSIGSAAAEVENAALEADIHEVTEKAESLIQLCRRASFG